MAFTVRKNTSLWMAGSFMKEEYGCQTNNSLFLRRFHCNRFRCRVKYPRQFRPKY